MKQSSMATTNLRMEAERLNNMMNTLTLFSRRTTLEWLPEISTITGITGEQLSVMFELSIEPNQCLKQLSRNILAAPSNVSVLVQSMVQEGMINRMTDPSDRRRVLLRLSDEGESLFCSAQEHMIAKYQEYLNSLHDHDQKELDEAILSILKVMERIFIKA